MPCNRSLTTDVFGIDTTVQSSAAYDIVTLLFSLAILISCNRPCIQSSSNLSSNMPLEPQGLQRSFAHPAPSPSPSSACQVSRALLHIWHHFWTSASCSGAAQLVVQVSGCKAPSQTYFQPCQISNSWHCMTIQVMAASFPRCCSNCHRQAVGCPCTHHMVECNAAHIRKS